MEPRHATELKELVRLLDHEEVFANELVVGDVLVVDGYPHRVLNAIPGHKHLIGLGYAVKEFDNNQPVTILNRQGVKGFDEQTRSSQA